MAEMPGTSRTSYGSAVKRVKGDDAQVRSGAAIYCRVSKDDAGDLLAVTRQEQDCRKFCDARGWPVARVYTDDDVSAYNRRAVRPQYQQMLKDIANHRVDAVVVWALDRLHRQPRELESFLDTCEAAGLTNMACVGGDVNLSTNEGQFMARVMGAMDAKSSADTSRRIRRKVVEMAEAGKPWGRRLFGYNQDSSINVAEAEALREMVAGALAGKSLRGIGKWLTEAGIPTSQGNPVWTASTVHYVLRNPGITGLRTHRGVVVGEGAWEAIVDRETWNQLKAALNRPDRRAVTTPRVRLLSSLCFCGRCGHTLSYGAKKVLVCSAAAPGTGCGRLGIAIPRVENYVQDTFLKAVPDLVPRVSQEENDLPYDGDDPTEIEAQLRELAAMWGSGELTREEWMAARTRLQRRMTAANSALVAHQKSKSFNDAVPDAMTVAAAWPLMTEVEKHTVLGAFIDKIVIEPGTKGCKFNPQRIQIRWKA